MSGFKSIRLSERNQTRKAICHESIPMPSWERRSCGDETRVRGPKGWDGDGDGDGERSRWQRQHEVIFGGMKLPVALLVR